MKYTNTKQPPTSISNDQLEYKIRTIFNAITYVSHAKIFTISTPENLKTNTMIASYIGLPIIDNCAYAIDNVLLKNQTFAQWTEFTNILYLV